MIDDHINAIKWSWDWSWRAKDWQSMAISYTC